MAQMFHNSGYTHPDPTRERARERRRDQQNKRALEERAKSSKDTGLKRSVREVLAFRSDQGGDMISQFLGGKRKGKTNKRKGKQRKGKQTRRKGKKQRKSK